MDAERRSRPHLVEVVVGGLDVERVLARRLLPAAVTGAGEAPPAVVVEDGWVPVQVELLSCGKIHVRFQKLELPESVSQILSEAEESREDRY